MPQLSSSLSESGEFNVQVRSMELVVVMWLAKSSESTIRWPGKQILFERYGAVLKEYRPKCFRWQPVNWSTYVN